MPLPAATPLRRTLRQQPIERPPTLVAIVTERVRQSIVDGEFKLGEFISEDRVATSLQVSRTPVREALTAQGLEFPREASLDQLRQTLAATSAHNQAIIKKLKLKLGFE